MHSLPPQLPRRVLVPRLCFALLWLLAEMVPTLTTLGLAGSALLVSTLFGPSQVLVRFAHMNSSPCSATRSSLRLSACRRRHSRSLF